MATITERQRDKGREIGQIRDTQERNTDTQKEEDSRVGQGRAEKGRVGYNAC